MIELTNRYLAGLMDPGASLLELQKLMYFMQEAGENLSLRYKKAPYGPYAENLRHVLNAIEGHYLLGYSNGGDAPHRFTDRFETPFGLELLTTVHWAVTREEARGLAKSYAV